MNPRHKAMLKIVRLSEVTTARGFTEGEVRTADAKIQKLLDAHNLKFRQPRRRRWWHTIWSIACRTPPRSPTSN